MPYLLLTQCAAIQPRLRRYPLRRVVLPALSMPEDGYPSNDLVWWVEHCGQKYYLRAKMAVTEVFFEKEQTTGRLVAAWKVLSQESDRISWPTSRDRSLEVPKALTQHLHCATHGPDILSIDGTTHDAFELRRSLTPQRVENYSLARQSIEKLLTQTRHQRPKFEATHQEMRKAWTYVRDYFSRSEVVQVADHDAYWVAAAVLLGLRQIPNREVEGTRTRSREFGEMLFRDFDDQSLIYTDRREYSEPGSIVVSLDVIADSTVRHQETLKDVARFFRQQGLLPQFNQLVDLCIGRADDVLFIEIKSATAENFDHQLRRAVGQLLEYKFRFRRTCSPRDISLALIIEDRCSPEKEKFVTEFLNDLGIDLILWNGDSVVLRHLLNNQGHVPKLSSASVGFLPRTTSAIANKSSTYTVPIPCPSACSTMVINSATEYRP